MRHGSSAWESNRLKTDVSPVQIRPVAHTPFHKNNKNFKNNLLFVLQNNHLLANIRVLGLEQKLPWEKTNIRGDKLKVSKNGSIVFEAILSGKDIHREVSSIGLGLQNAGKDISRFRTMLDVLLPTLAQNENTTVIDLIKKIESTPTISDMQKAELKKTENVNYIGFLADFFKIIKKNLDEVLPAEQRKNNENYTIEDINRLSQKIKTNIAEKNNFPKEKLVFDIHPAYLKYLIPAKQQNRFMAKITKIFGGK